MTLEFDRALRPSMRSTLRAGTIVQARVIGALIIRELHTRFGRHNVGYLWMLVEPAMLAMAVTALHLALRTQFPHHMQVASFTLSGYTPFLMFRSIILRAGPAVEANGTLLYHRMVTLLDLNVSRAILDALSTFATFYILLALAASVEMGNLPDRPLLSLAGWGLLLWLAFGIGMITCAASAMSETVERFVHPICYISLPLSGAFSLVEWFPRSAQDIILLMPLPHAFELIREGQFEQFESPNIDIPYLVAWCIALTFLGLISLRAVRPHLQLES